MRNRLHVDDRNVRVFRHRTNHVIGTIFIPVFEFWKRSDGDHIAVTRQDLGHLGDVLLGIAIHDFPSFKFNRPSVASGLQNHRKAAQLVSTHLERCSRSHGGIEKQQSHRLTFEILAVGTLLQLGCSIQHGLQVRLAPILSRNEVSRFLFNL